jgi:hypothetical protein
MRFEFQIVIFRLRHHAAFSPGPHFRKVGSYETLVTTDKAMRSHYQETRFVQQEILYPHFRFLSRITLVL